MQYIEWLRAEHSANDLKEIIKISSVLNGIIGQISSKYPKFIIEECAIAGALDHKLYDNKEYARRQTT